MNHYEQLWGKIVEGNHVELGMLAREGDGKERRRFGSIGIVPVLGSLEEDGA